MNWKGDEKKVESLVTYSLPEPKGRKSEIHQLDTSQQPKSAYVALIFSGYDHERFQPKNLYFLNAEEGNEPL